MNILDIVVIEEVKKILKQECEDFFYTQTNMPSCQLKSNIEQKVSKRLSLLDNRQFSVDIYKPDDAILEIVDILIDLCYSPELGKKYKVSCFLRFV